MVPVKDVSRACGRDNTTLGIVVPDKILLGNMPCRTTEPTPFPPPDATGTGVTHDAPEKYDAADSGIVGAIYDANADIGLKEPTVPTVEITPRGLVITREPFRDPLRELGAEPGENGFAK